MEEVVLASINEDNSFFLIKRKFDPFKGFWSFPGGKRKGAESLEETAIRETKEETNLDIQIIKKIADFVHQGVKIHLYSCSADSRNYKINNEESLNGGWCNPQVIRYLEIIPKLKKYLN